VKIDTVAYTVLLYLQLQSLVSTYGVMEGASWLGQEWNQAEEDVENGEWLCVRQGETLVPEELQQLFEHHCLQ
jgi:hypothetical protein